MAEPVVVIARYAADLHGGHVDLDLVRAEVADAIGAGRVGVKRPRFVDPDDDFVLNPRRSTRWVWDAAGGCAWVVVRKRLVGGVAWVVTAQVAARAEAA